MNERVCVMCGNWHAASVACPTCSPPATPPAAPGMTDAECLGLLRVAALDEEVHPGPVFREAIRYAISRMEEWGRVPSPWEMLNVQDSEIDRLNDLLSQRDSELREAREVNDSRKTAYELASQAAKEYKWATEQADAANAALRLRCAALEAEGEAVSEATYGYCAECEQVYRIDDPLTLPTGPGDKPGCFECVDDDGDPIPLSPVAVIPLAKAEELRHRCAALREALRLYEREHAKAYKVNGLDCQCAYCKAARALLEVT